MPIIQLCTKLTLTFLYYSSNYIKDCGDMLATAYIEQNTPTNIICHKLQSFYQSKEFLLFLLIPVHHCSLFYNSIALYTMKNKSGCGFNDHTSSNLLPTTLNVCCPPKSSSHNAAHTMRCATCSAIALQKTYIKTGIMYMEPIIHHHHLCYLEYFLQVVQNIICILQTHRLAHIAGKPRAVILQEFT